MLVGTSLFSVLLLSLHFAQDAYHARPGTIDAGPGSLIGILLMTVLLIGPALLPERRSGRSACPRSTSIFPETGAGSATHCSSSGV